MADHEWGKTVSRQVPLVEIRTNREHSLAKLCIVCSCPPSLISPDAALANSRLSAVRIADMGRRPSDGLRYTVERKNNNGNYEPGNCVWATYGEQARNKRGNRLITHNGRTQCLSAWAAESKVSPEHFRGRLRDGWPMDEALAAPPSGRKKRKGPRADAKGPVVN